MTDRAKLEEALACFRQGMPDPGSPLLSALVAAADAHLATLPRTKMAETWHVEYWDSSGDEPRISVCADKVIAESRALAIKGGVATCIRVTGPHQHLVPA